MDNFEIKNINNITNSIGIIQKWKTPQTGFSYVMSKALEGESGFSKAFPSYVVMEKTGYCNVSSSTWCRNDFPFWKYFEQNSTADSLNNWKAIEPEPNEFDPEIQGNVDQIPSGAMSIIIPKKLQSKMDANPEFAKEVYEKVLTWKDNYDRSDNAMAVALGYNATEHQLSKSYCIKLDENGNVEDYTVVSGGSDSKANIEEEEELSITKSRVRRPQNREKRTRISSDYRETEYVHDDYNYENGVIVSATMLLGNYMKNKR